MKSKMVGTVLLLLSVLPASAAEPAAGEEVSWALIFSPQSYQAIAGAAALRNGALALQQQLIEGGFARQRIVFLDGSVPGEKQAATAGNLRAELARLGDAAGKDDLVLVVIASYGVQKDGCDFVCAADASAADLDRAAPQATANGLIPLQEIVRIMAMSASQKRFLMVDHAGSKSPFAGAAGASQQAGLADRFGSQPLQVPDGQWIVCSRSGRLGDAGGKTPVTCFMSSVLDGLRSNADSNRDAKVSAFEILDYVQLYADTLGYAPPVLHGKTNVDFDLAATTEDAGIMASLPEEQRELLSRNALRAGCATLLAERDAAGATWAFFEAEPYLASQEQTRENFGLYLTALASMGQVEQALSLAKANGVPLLVHLPAAAAVHEKDGSAPASGSGSWGRGYGERPVATLAAGTLLSVTDVSGGRFRFDRSFVRQFDAGVLRYAPADAQPGWVDISSLTGKAQAAGPFDLALNPQD